jgi:hypothetical protein
VVCKTLARRWFVDPRGQHFQIDQFVEFERSFGHGVVLLQRGKIVMSGEVKRR